MSNEHESTGGADRDQTSGLNDQIDVTNNDKSPAGYVLLESHKKLLGEKKRKDEQVRELMARLEAFEAEKKAFEEANLIKNEEYKKLSEKYKEENRKLLENEKRREEEDLLQIKYSSFIDRLGAGLKNKKYASLIPWEDIKIDFNTKEVDDYSLEIAINKFKEEHEDLIAYQQSNNIPQNSPQGNHTGVPSLEQWQAMSAKDQLKYQSAVYEKYFGGKK